MNDIGYGNGRRAHERRALHGAAEIVAEGYGTVPVSIVDISVEGMRIVAPFNPREGVLFLLKTRLPLRPSGSLGVEVNVRVANSILTGHEDGFTVGLTFLNLSDEAEQAIRGYIRVPD
ncbi:PilZ domain-containing protein [Thiorhodococcus mannitoliphagus]|uniref:PilZ domain-containing protein n=1 Tax=Thiorhodococcus mannitoliphagus TaxID=329406 RepID=A0A6P1DP21_9GAMM|nr:PilZ domain-containing protein [Thiorhodococcus mannitoliphagus]NEX19290.1 PilZ domain-containing protein [Thiorhodococcus mannitoliphagus]